MKNSIAPFALSLSLLTAGLSFLVVPEASAKLTKPQVKRCLTGRFQIRLTETVEEEDLSGVPISTTPVNVTGRLRIRGAVATFNGLKFNYTRTMVRGRKKIVRTGGVEVIAFPNNDPGTLRIVIVKRGGRAKITSGTFTRSGAMGNAFTVDDGRITGSKRLSKACKH